MFYANKKLDTTFQDIGLLDSIKAMEMVLKQVLDYSKCWGNCYFIHKLLLSIIDYVKFIDHKQVYDIYIIVSFQNLDFSSSSKDKFILVCKRG